MIFFPLPGVDANKRGLLAINHEFPDTGILGITNYNAATANTEQKKIVLSAVGVSMPAAKRLGAHTSPAKKLPTTTYPPRSSTIVVRRVDGKPVGA
jgi:secreted PhoX family phosphatase